MAWLTLLLQALGLLVAVAVVAAVAVGRVERSSLRAGAAAVAAVAFLFAMAPQTYGTLKHLNEQRRQYRGLPEYKARERCLVDGGNQDVAPFVHFVRDQVPPKARYVVVGELKPDLACLTFVLSPRLIQGGPENADYAVFSHGIPPGWQARMVPGSVRRFRGEEQVAKLR